MMMKHKPLRVLVSASLLAALVAPALAAGPMAPGKLTLEKERQYPYTAETSAPAQRQGPVRAGGVDWQCAGARCMASGPAPTPGVGTCKALAQQVGALKAYRHAKQRLGADEVAQCNGAVAAPAPIAAKVTRKSRSATAPGITPIAPNPGGAVQQAAPAGAKGDVPGKPPATAATAGTPSARAINRMPAPRPAGIGVPPKQAGIGTPQAMAPAAAAGSKKGGFAPADRSAAVRTGPVSFTTATFTVTGTGALHARASFSPRSFTTETLTATGTGALR